MQNYGQFADTKTYAQGDKPVFRVRVSEYSKKRAKSFVTRVGLAGRYETFKLDGYTMEVNMAAYGGAAEIGFEEFLDGRITMADVYNLVLEGLDEVVYKEIAKAMTQLANSTNIPRANKVKGNTWNENEFDRLVATADVYGKSTIYCTYEFAATIRPMNGTAINYNALSDRMKEDLWNNGTFGNYKGHTVIILPQIMNKRLWTLLALGLFLLALKNLSRLLSKVLLLLEKWKMMTGQERFRHTRKWVWLFIM